MNKHKEKQLRTKDILKVLRHLKQICKLNTKLSYLIKMYEYLEESSKKVNETIEVTLENKEQVKCKRLWM